MMKNKVSNTTIELVLKMSFLEPMDVLILTKFIIYQKSNECKTIIRASNPVVFEYLKAIGIVDFVKKNYKSPETIEGIPSLTAMPIRRVERETMNWYITATQNFMRSICPTKDLEVLNICLSELINNVYDHSSSPIGAYVFCQYFPNKNIISVAVSDYGIGIPKSVNRFLRTEDKPQLSNAKCIAWAIKEHKTTKSEPHNMGRGLDTVKSFVAANNSSWKVYSDNVMMIGYPSSNKYSDNIIYNMKGTIVALNIKVDNLDEQGYVEDALDW